MFSLASLVPNLTTTAASSPEGAPAKGDAAPGEGSFSNLLAALEPQAGAVAGLPQADAAPVLLALPVGDDRQLAAESGKVLPVELPAGSLDQLPATELVIRPWQQPSANPVKSVTTEQPLAPVPNALLPQAPEVTTSEPATKLHPATKFDVATPISKNPFTRMHADLQGVATIDSVVAELGLTDTPATSAALSPSAAPVVLTAATPIVAPVAGSVEQPAEQSADRPSLSTGATAHPMEQRANEAAPATANSRYADYSAAPAASQREASTTREASFINVQVAPEATAPAAAALPTDSMAEAEATQPAPLAAAKTKAPKAAPAAMPARASLPMEHAAPSSIEATSPSPLAAATAFSSPQAPAAVHDLARIVDRLAAAREALLPAAAALSIDHSEFGELSLRFDQRTDGALSVQLSASNPEAHEAVRAAVAADRSHFSSGGDNGSGNQAQTSQQSSSASTNQSQARGGSAEREANGNAASNRQDQPQQRQGNGRDTASRNNQQQRDGIFA